VNLLASAETDVFRYFQDTMRLLADEAPDLAIAKAADVWQHVDFGETIHVHRKRGDKYVEAGVYLSVECSCEWEREHGLQLVFRDGIEVVKVGIPNPARTARASVCLARRSAANRPAS
jgi:hypothetical protein